MASTIAIIVAEKYAQYLSDIEFAKTTAAQRVAEERRNNPYAGLSKAAIKAKRAEEALTDEQRRQLEWGDA